MKPLAVTLLLLLSLAGSLSAADVPCTMCVGVEDRTASGPLVLARISLAELSTFTPKSPSVLTAVVAYEATGENPLQQIEQATAQIIEWARVLGPLDGLGVDIVVTDPAMAAFAVKRLAVVAQGQNVANNIVAANGESLQLLHDQGALAYVDAVVTQGSRVEETAATLASLDPSKKVYASVETTSPNPLFDLARALGAGAARAYASTPVDSASLAAFNRAMTGDWAFDSTATTDVLDAKGTVTQMPVLSFVRGEDLRTLLVPRSEAAAASILSLPADRYSNPRRVAAEGENAITDVATRNGKLLVGLAAPKSPFAVLVDHVQVAANVTKETISVATDRGITVEEIIRNHQAYDSYQESIEPKYIARNTTNLRFDIGGGAEALEATIAGEYFSDRGTRSDWVWSEFYINGVKWKYGKIPELPLLQPEKVTQLPLDLHLTNDYRYELVRTTDVLGFRVYEVRFEPPANAPSALPLYRGTVFIDSRTWARIRISMVQLNLSGEILSNEERVDFAPFARSTRLPLSGAEVASAPAREIIWLPHVVSAQQVISAAGRASVVQRDTKFDHFRLDPPEFESLLATTSASDALMVRETAAGLRYLEKKDGQRVVKEGFDTAQLFLVGGIHHDDGLEYPVVPLGGVDYFNFDLFGKGIQTNVFFAGVVLAANATHPDVGGTRTNVGFDFFGIAIPTESKVRRGGIERPEETIKALPMGLFARVGHPFAQFGKIDLSVGVSHQSYQRAETTGADFVVPSDTFIFTPGIEVRYARKGWSFSTWFDYNQRSTWEPWGDVETFDPEQKSFTRFGASLGKSFYLPKFQRIGVDLTWVDGQRLDRFSRYELGFFGAQRVHGIASGTVRAEKMILGHLSYGFVLSEQFRLEAFYDHALIDDASAALEGEPYQGIGIAGQTIGPFGTLLRLDVGKSIGRNAQDGLVANVVFLKLF
jgi:hypothetical protein